MRQCPRVRFHQYRQIRTRQLRCKGSEHCCLELCSVFVPPCCSYSTFGVMTGCTAYEEDEAIAINFTAKQQPTERSEVVKLPSHPPGDMLTLMSRERHIVHRLPVQTAAWVYQKENDSQKKRDLIINNYDINFDIQTGKPL